MQELKSMGVQMRLITEDSIDKLTIHFMDIKDKFYERRKKVFKNNIGQDININEKMYKPNQINQINPGEIARVLIKTRYDEITREKIGLDDESEKQENYILEDNKYRNNSEIYDLIPAEKVREFNLDENLSTTLEIGSIVATRTLDNLVSAKRFRVDGINEKYNQYHLIDLNPMAIEKGFLELKMKFIIKE